MKIIEILRLSELGVSQRQIAASAGCGKSTIGRVLKLCQEKGISHESAAQMTDESLQATLHPESTGASETAQYPDWKYIHEELVKHKNLNLQFMWEEYRAHNPTGLGYSRFCELYREYRKTSGRQVSLYHERKAGEIMEVDWMGISCPA